MDFHVKVQVHFEVHDFTWKSMSFHMDHGLPCGLTYSGLTYQSPWTPTWKSMDFHMDMNFQLGSPWTSTWTWTSTWNSMDFHMDMDFQLGSPWTSTLTWTSTWNSMDCPQYLANRQPLIISDLLSHVIERHQRASSGEGVQGRMTRNHYEVVIGIYQGWILDWSILCSKGLIEEKPKTSCGLNCLAVSVIWLYMQKINK